MLLCLPPLFVRVVDSSLRELRLFMQTLRKPLEHILETAGAVRAGDCTTAAASGAVSVGDSATATEVSPAMYAFSKVDRSVKGRPNTGRDFEGRHKSGYHQDFKPP